MSRHKHHQHINFDTVLAFNILKFTHHEEWYISKPFLISSSFRNVYQSDEFAKHYLKNWFKLSEEETNQLETFGLEFGRTWGRKDNNIDEQPKKKRKKEIVTEDFYPPQTMNEILQMFIKLSFQVNLEKTKARIISALSNYKKGETDSAEKISKIKNLVGLMESDERIVQSFKKFGKRSVSNVETKDKEFSLSRLTVEKCFGNVKDVFLLDRFEEEKINDLVTTNKVIVFTNIGYPLLLEATYIQGASFEQSEMLHVYYHKLFNNFRRDDVNNLARGHFSQNHDQELLDSLKTIILSSRANEFLIGNGVRINQIEDVKQAIIYDYLQMSFGSFNSSFRLDSLGWIPFVGKVKSDENDILLDDDESEEDSSDDSDY